MVDRKKSRRERRIHALLLRAESALLSGDDDLAPRVAHLEATAARAELDAAIGEAKAEGDDVEKTLDRLARLDAAVRAPTGNGIRRVYLDRHGVVGVHRFRAGAQTTIWLLPIETFPRHVNNVYLVVEPGHVMLFDVGSGLDSSRRDLELAMAVLRRAFDEPHARWDAIDTLVVSHAHIDHFGGLNAAQKETSARVAVHELDARVLACFDERIVVASKDLDVFLRRAGVGADDRARYAAMYGASKNFFKAVEPGRVLRDGDRVGGGWRVHHVPGHCPGLICLQVHDVLLTSDHVLARITPHQFPQAITAFGGLEHYFHSLAKIRKLEGINLALGGHEEPIDDLRARIDGIALFHRERLAEVLRVCNSRREDGALSSGKTVVDVAKDLFGHQEGYGSLLALEEAGAHVEYLHQLGQLKIDNLSEVASATDPVIRYVARG